MKAFAVCVFALMIAGCAYSPAHLNSLYARRNHFQGLINDVEARYSLPSRDTDKAELKNLKETHAQLKMENELLRRQLELRAEHK